MLVIEQCILPNDFHSREINTMEVIWEVNDFHSREINTMEVIWEVNDFHSREINTMEVNGEDCLALQNIFFCVQHKKETYTGLERHVGE